MMGTAHVLFMEPNIPDVLKLHNYRVWNILLYFKFTAISLGLSDMNIGCG